MDDRNDPDRRDRDATDDGTHADEIPPAAFARALLDGIDDRSLDGIDGRTPDESDGRSLDGSDGRSFGGSDGQSVDGNDERPLSSFDPSVPDDATPCHRCPHALPDGGTDNGRADDGGADGDGGADDGGSHAADDDGRFDRRGVAKILATVGGLAAVGSLAAPLAGLTRVFEREYTGPIYSDGVPLVDAEGTRIEEGRLDTGDYMTAFPETRPGIPDAPTLLVRYPESEYGEPTLLESTASGYAAYSKVCTHAGCMVSDRDGQTLVCPCHFGKFNPVQGASVVGGPPPRPLPQLPLSLSNDGYLVAAGDFEAPVGVQE